MIDNIFSNATSREIISRNIIIDNISDYMPNFVVVQDYTKSELRIRYQKSDYSKFYESQRSILKTENNTNVNYAYKIFHEHLKKHH